MRAFGTLIVGAAAVLLALIGRTAWLAIHPRRNWRPSPDWTPSPLPLTPVTFVTLDGVHLRGWFATQPAAPATVICVHGWGTNHTEMEWRAYRLYAAGYAVLLFDFRASGESEGRTTSLGFFEVHDLEAALRLAQTRPEFHGAPILILADSMGASVALIVAAKNPAVRAVWSDGAFATLEGAIAWGFRTVTKLPGRPFQRMVVWVAEWLGGVRVRDVNVTEAIGKIAPRPVYLAHGLDDPLVSPQDAEDLYACAGEPKFLWLQPGARHVVGAYVPLDEYVARAIEFFRSALGAGPAAAAAPEGPSAVASLPAARSQDSSGAAERPAQI